MQLRTIYCNTHVYTFHVCLCLLALAFVCNSTYLLKYSFQSNLKSTLEKKSGERTMYHVIYMEVSMQTEKFQI